LQCSDRLGKILEGGAAKQEVERLIFEGHAGRVAPLKIDLDSSLGCVPASDFDESVADIETSDTAASELRQFDCEVTWPWCDLKHLASGWDLIGDAPGQHFEFV
jgi:hypothetical protein